MVWWQIILLPFAILYDLITRVRNLLYSNDILSSFKFEANVISIGNLSVGGTGKTPMTEYLVRYFSDKSYKISTLSRGYGRKSKGFREVRVEDSSKTAGDEPLMLKRFFPKELSVFVGEKRVEAIPNILMHDPENDIIILDDAFQHRSVEPSLSILLTTYDRPFYRDYLLPSGLLRESRQNASRADLVMVTKCPLSISFSERQDVTEGIKEYAPDIDVFFSAMELQEPKPIFEEHSKKSGVIAVAGIANPDSFFSMMSKKYDVRGTLAFADHYEFSQSDVDWMQKLMERENAMLCCTSKDAIKLAKFDSLSILPVFEIPLDFFIIDQEERFLGIIEDSIKSYPRDF